MDGRWLARLSLAAGTVAVLVLLLFAGLRSVVLVGAGAAGLAVTAAGVWWVLAHRGVVRALALVLAVAAPLAVLVLYVAAGLLWVVLVSLGLWALAVSAGRAALVGETGQAAPRESPPTAPPGPS